ncbi:hypothetical protein [Bryobacter aggregatus]|uniref:hypothetical protein n=1 Tax=Bryobacter aggregatus TaxID=360054 RepID=UPI0004E232E3|nr:hypothetical protein [Bryobacter aggregatus]
MFAQFLIPQSTITANGSGAAVALHAAAGALLQLTLVIEKIVEQQSLEIHIEGSADGATWAEKPLLVFPQKFYTGQSALLLDLAAHPEITQVRATWKAHRWGRGELTPHFGVYLFAEAHASLKLDSK